MERIEDLLNRGYRYAFSLTHNQDDAKDLVQEACAQIHSKNGPWNVGYLFKTIKNKYIDQIRRSKRVKFDSMDAHTELPDYPERSGDQIDIQLYLSKLRDEEREALYLSVVEGYTTKEISRLLEKPQGTILSLIHRAKERLKSLIVRIGRVDK